MKPKKLCAGCGAEIQPAGLGKPSCDKCEKAKEAKSLKEVGFFRRKS